MGRESQYEVLNYLWLCSFFGVNLISKFPLFPPPLFLSLLSLWSLKRKGGKKKSIPQRKAFYVVGNSISELVSVSFWDLILTASSASLHLHRRARQCRVRPREQPGLGSLHRPAEHLHMGRFACPSHPFFPFRFIKPSAHRSHLHSCLSPALPVAFVGVVAYLSRAAAATVLGLGRGRRGRRETFVYFLSQASQFGLMNKRYAAKEMPLAFPVLQFW